MSQELLEDFDLQGKLIIADKGYDSDKFVKWVEERGGIVVIPSLITAENPRDIDKHICNERYLTESLFLKIKNNRRFATRYKKKAIFFQDVTFLACILACILVWLF